MAIYHTRLKTFSRAKGHSAIAAAAYRAGVMIMDETTGVRHDYLRREGVVGTICIAPAHAPEWAVDPGRLWPAAEACERRRDATLCREFEVALAHELNEEQRLALVEDISGTLVKRYGFAVQASIHSPSTPNGLNWHVHILATTRRLDESGFTEKTRELDGGASGRAQVEWVREMVAERTNEHLARAGLDCRVDHRSLIEQSKAAEQNGDLTQATILAREPTKHVGKTGTALMRRGEVSDLHTENLRITQTNQDKLDQLLASFEREGRLMATPTGHSHQAARRERQGSISPVSAAFRPRGEFPVALTRHRALRSGTMVPLRTTARASGVASRSAREKEIDLLMREALRAWQEGIDETLRQSLAAVDQILTQREGLIRLHAHRVGFHSDMKELHRAITRASRDQSRWARRLEAERSAQFAVDQAKWELAQLDGQSPKSSLWSKRAWAERRRRQECRVQEKRLARDQAREATGPEAQVRYSNEAKQSTEALRMASVRMLTAYPVEKTVETPVSETSENDQESNPQARAKGMRPASTQGSETDDENGEQKLTKRHKTSRPPQSKLH